MSKPVDLKVLEHKAFLSYHEDGILDLYLGFMLVWISILIVILPEFFIFLVGSFVALIPAYTESKKSITVPRLGYVEFSTKRRVKTRNLILVFVILSILANILGMVAWLIPAIGNLIVRYHLIIFGGVGAAIFLLIAYGTGIRRFYGYGLIVFVSFIGSHLFLPSILFPLFALGIAMIIVGGILLYKFTRKYPKPEGQDFSLQSEEPEGA
jgi:hypothetical protein